MSICRCCHQDGHNIRTCPTFRKSAIENPEGYAARRLIRNATKDQNRVCSYCNMNGHNKTTCQKQKNDHVAAIGHNAQYRKRIFEKMKEHKIAIGMLFEASYSFGDSLLIAETIEWDNILYTRQERSLFVAVDGETKPYWGLNIDDDFFRTLEAGNIIIHNPGSEQYIGYGMPTTWLNGISGVKKTF